MGIAPLIFVKILADICTILAKQKIVKYETDIGERGEQFKRLN
jgi:hypothetical protein